MAPRTKKIYPISTDLNADQDIDGLLSGVAWDPAFFSVGYAVPTITYSYPNSASDYGSRYGNNEPKTGFKALNETQRDAVDSVIKQFDSVIAWSFKQVPFGDAADATATIRYAESNKPSTAWAYYPSERPEGGDVWFNNAKHYYDNPKAGNYAWFTFLHETGHALGLKHPHENVATFGVLGAAHDSMEYSVMSYRSYVGDSLSGGYANEQWGFAQTLMMDDIAALQYMYGADWSTNSGNTVYTWNPLTGQESINGDGQSIPGGNRIFMTIWDGGGNDTYDFSNYSTNLLVDLQPGHWTTTDTVYFSQTAHLDFYEGNTHLAAGNIANALTYKTYNSVGAVTSESLNSLIENALGGSGNDTFIGNQIANAFNGGPGNDTLTGGLGTDTFVFTAMTDGLDHITDFGPGTSTTTVDTLEFKVGAGNFSIGNNNTTVDNFHFGDNASINVAGTEIGVKTDLGVTTDTVQSTIDGYGNITTGALFEFLDTTKGHAAVYYDPNPNVAGGATLVAELDNITTLADLLKFNASDFHFIT